MYYKRISVIYNKIYTFYISSLIYICLICAHFSISLKYKYKLHLNDIKYILVWKYLLKY
jgi:hypothetical protein